MEFYPYFLKYLVNCPCFKIIKHRVLILKLEFKKIEFHIELDFMIIEF